MEDVEEGEVEVSQVSLVPAPSIDSLSQHQPLSDTDTSNALEAMKNDVSTLSNTSTQFPSSSAVIASASAALRDPLAPQRSLSPAALSSSLGKAKDEKLSFTASIERQREKERAKEREREREREKERGRSSSTAAAAAASVATSASVSGEKRGRDHDRDRDYDRRERDRERELEREKEKERDRERDRERERERERGRDRQRDRNDRGRDSEGDRDRDRDARRDRDRDYDRDQRDTRRDSTVKPKEPVSVEPVVEISLEESEDEDEKIARLRAKRQAILAASVQTTAAPSPAASLATESVPELPVVNAAPVAVVAPPVSVVAPVVAPAAVPEPIQAPLAAPEPVPIVAAAPQPKKPKVRDMFASVSPIQETGAVTKASDSGANAPTTLNDNWDDSEGYYRMQPGEILGNFYRIQGYSNKGVFSSVLRAEDQRSNEEKREVAIKVLRANDVMYKTGEKEYEILRKLQREDPTGKYHCVTMLGKFDHRGHFCIVFEQLNMNLRELIRKVGNGIGLNLSAVRTYAKQLFMALRLVRKCELIHGDIKPDNILVGHNNAVLKLCDFGSAMSIKDNEITPYLVTRFYRAPEIMLGLKYDYAIDVWAIACTLYELYTGQILFQGNTNNEMLMRQQELLGRFPGKMIRAGMFRGNHFDQDDNFLYIYTDRISGSKNIRVINRHQPTEDLMKKLLEVHDVQGEEKKQLQQFKDLLMGALALDPSKRLTPKDCLKHPFFAAPQQPIVMPAAAPIPTPGGTKIMPAFKI